MSQLLKFECMKNWSIVVAMLIVIAIFSYFDPDDYFHFIFSLFMLIVFTQHTDEEHRFFISLPVKKGSIVLSHYLFIVLASSGFLLFQLFLYWLVSANNHTLFLLLFTVPFSFSIMIGLIAIALPFYYFFKSQWTAFFAQLVTVVALSILFTGWLSSPFTYLTDKVMDIIVIEPISISIISCLLVLFLSYKISCWIFYKRDYA